MYSSKKLKPPPTTPPRNPTTEIFQEFSDHFAEIKVSQNANITRPASSSSSSRSRGGSRSRGRSTIRQRTSGDRGGGAIEQQRLARFGEKYA